MTKQELKDPFDDFAAAMRGASGAAGGAIHAKSMGIGVGTIAKGLAAAIIIVLGVVVTIKAVQFVQGINPAAAIISGFGGNPVNCLTNTINSTGKSIGNSIPEACLTKYFASLQKQNQIQSPAQFPLGFPPLAYGCPGPRYRTPTYPSTYPNGYGCPGLPTYCNIPWCSVPGAQPNCPLGYGNSTPFICVWNCPTPGNNTFCGPPAQPQCPGFYGICSNCYFGGCTGYCFGCFGSGGGQSCASFPFCNYCPSNTC